MKKIKCMPYVDFCDDYPDKQPWLDRQDYRTGSCTYTTSVHPW